MSTLPYLNQARPTYLNSYSAYVLLGILHKLDLAERPKRRSAQVELADRSVQPDTVVIDSFSSLT